MGTPSHLQSPRTIMAKLLMTRQLPPALPQPPPPPPSDPSKITTEQPAPALPRSPPPLDLPKTIIEHQQPARAPSKIILQPRHRTSPAMWCAAIVCFAFSVLIIVAGAVTLIVFLALKPRPPSFDAANAVLNSVVYAASPPPYINSDMTLVVNVSNPNQRIDLAFRSATVELLFQDRPVAAQALPPFARRRGQSQVLDVRLVSSRVLLPPELAVEMVDQVRSNRVVYTVRAAFRVEARFGFGHYSYWMYTVCQLELTAPPCGVLVARRCRTKS